MTSYLLRAVRPARETKRAPLALANVDATGVFEGYASLFGVVDLGRDVVMPGAFRDSLSRRGVAGVKMLWQHKAAEPIGTWVQIEEDIRGLRVTGRLNLAVAKAREVLALMRDGAVDGLSIGFRADHFQRDPASGVRRLKKIDLWEISLVTFPMLPQARVTALKQARPAPVHMLRQRWIAAAQACERALLRGGPGRLTRR
jgi:HK97 family phage prohead protease